MFGSHLSIAGSMTNALDEARRLRMDCVQVFTKNQRQWRTTPLKDEDRDAWLAALAKLCWDTTSDSGAPARVVSHNSYLINMASPDSETWEKSVRLQRVELERCEALHIPLCVSHPGAHLGEGVPAGAPLPLGRAPTRDERAGLKCIAKALNRLHRELRGCRTITCLETTAGAGTNLGGDFAHLAWIRDHVHEPERLAFCFDTCHVTAAGYDMTTDAAARATMEQFNAICGRSLLRVFHLNDSKHPVGSRKDRHAHIGDGLCGRSCFRMIVNDPAFADVPKILETPKGDNDRGEPWDRVNIRRLKRLVRRQRSADSTSGRRARPATRPA